MGNSSLNTGRPKFGKLFYKNWSLSTDLLQRQKATRKWPSIASLQAFRTLTRFARSGSLPFPSPSDACHPPATHATRSREINILTVFDVKSTFLNLPFFWVSEREIDILTVLDVKSSFFYLRRCMKSTFSCSLSVNSTSLLSPFKREINMSTVLDVKSTFLQLRRCMKSTFCCFLSEINIGTVAWTF